VTLMLSARVSGENCASAFNDRVLQLILGGPMTAVAPFRDLRVKGLSSCLRAPKYPCVALRCPTYLENSHANCQRRLDYRLIPAV